MAKTFFSAPAISTPTTSSVVYTRKRWVRKNADSRVARCLSGIASTAAAHAALGHLARDVRPGQDARRMTGQHLLDDLRHPHVGALFEPLDEGHHRHPRPQFSAQLGKHSSETMGGHAHDDDVGAVGGLREVGGGAQGVAQDDIIAEAAAVAVMSLAVASERTHCSVGPRRAQIEATVVPHEPPSGTTILDNNFGFALLSCHGDQCIADTRDLEAVHQLRAVCPTDEVETNDLWAGDFGPYPRHAMCRIVKGRFDTRRNHVQTRWLRPGFRVAVCGCSRGVGWVAGHRVCRWRSSTGQPAGKGGGDDTAGRDVPRGPNLRPGPAAQWPDAFSVWRRFDFPLRGNLDLHRFRRQSRRLGGDGRSLRRSGERKRVDTQKCGEYVYESVSRLA